MKFKLHQVSVICPSETDCGALESLLPVPTAQTLGALDVEFEAHEPAADGSIQLDLYPMTPEGAKIISGILSRQFGEA